KSYAITFTAVGIAFSSQYFFILDRKVELNYLLAPFLVALILGTLLTYINIVRAQLKDSNEQFRAVVDIAEEFIYYRDLNGTYKYISPSCEKLTGYSADVFYHNPFFMNTIIHEPDRELWMNHVHGINEKYEAETIDIRIKHKSGEIKWMKHVCATVTDAEGKQIGVRSSNIDITEQKNHENQIFNMAYYDPLTNLPNRRLFEQNLESMIEKARETNDVFSVMFLDLDRFKNINDSFGHKLGDKVLVAVTQLVLEKCQDHCLFSRFGGDEFVLICSEIENTRQATEFANKLIKKIEQPIFIDDISIYISASIGVAFFPENGDNVSLLIRNADTAMYKTKKHVTSKVLFYNAEFGNEASHFISTEQSIHKALDAREFVPYYQPKIDMSSGKIIGAEALARWVNPEQGIIMPDKFINVAEETFQIVDIGKQIIEKVLNDMNQWKMVNCEIPVSINISVRQFSNNSFFSELVELLETYKVKPEHLEIEITEQVFLGDLVMAKRRLNEFRSAGFKIALDDFGTGYSSMSYLHELPIDILKIDKSFVDNLAHDKKSLAIMKAIASLSRDLNYEMIAEGVEDEHQKNILLGLDCIDAQGYYFHKPMPMDDLTDVLIEQISDTLNRL
ncbi:MAG: EAL domain-containing protein, partial [Gammaproteobacteria bacterium]|nr:EAL domain-containing protein [Gammaproteobacteria bacterium]